MVTKQNIIHWHMLGMSQRSIARQVKHSIGHHRRTARQNGLATKNSLGSLGLPAFFLFPKSHELFGNPVWIGYLCALSHEKTILDLLHSLGVEDDMIMFDNFGG